MLKTPKKGDLAVHVPELDSHFLVGCLYHRGEAVVGTETRIDPDTEAPRARRVWNETEAVWEQVPVEFPIYSETETKPGFDSSCELCQRSLFEARQHANAIAESSARADYEFEAELARRGMNG